MKKVLIILGTRPEAIKLLPVIWSLQPDHSVTVCNSGQHREMLDPFIADFGLVVHHDLDVLAKALDPGAMTGYLVMKLGDVIRREDPELVVVQGDTTTALAGALAAFYEATPVVHVEAGLRTHDKKAPFPEEVNRQLVARLADHHFAPTQTARDHLIIEGIPNHTISVVGNTVIDLLVGTKERLQDRDLPPDLAAFLDDSLDGAKRRVILVTTHRRESFGQGIRNICSAIAEIASKYPNDRIILPVHKNPKVAAPIRETLGGIENLLLTEPLGYLTFIQILDACDLVVTDSGGIQEEAPSLGKPVLVVREKTERVEGIEAGTARLVGSNIETIVSGVSMLLEDEEEYDRMATAHNPYGDGFSSKRIADQIRSMI